MNDIFTGGNSGQAHVFDGEEFQVKNTSEMDAPAPPQTVIPEGTQIIDDSTYNQMANGETVQNAAVEQPQAEKVIDELVYELQLDSKVRDPRDGQVKPFQQIANEENLRQKLDKRYNEEIRPQVELIKANQPFLEAATRSTAAQVMLSALKNGATEEQAIAAANASIGFASSPQQKVDNDPEPQQPDVESDDPAMGRYVLDHLRWEQRQELKKMQESFKEEIASIKTSFTQKELEREQQKQELSATHQHNVNVYTQVLNALVPNYNSLTPEQQAKFNDAVDKATISNGIDAEMLASTKLNERDMKAVVMDALQQFKPVVPQAQGLRPTNNVNPAQPLKPGASSGGVLKPDPYTQHDPLASFRGVLEKI